MNAPAIAQVEEASQACKDVAEALRNALHSVETQIQKLTGDLSSAALVRNLQAQRHALQGAVDSNHTTRAFLNRILS